jgi:hypothetical protein
MLFLIQFRHLSALLSIVIIEASCAAIPANLRRKWEVSEQLFAKVPSLTLAGLLLEQACQVHCLDCRTPMAEDHERCCLAEWLFNVLDLIAGNVP